MDENWGCWVHYTDLQPQRPETPDAVEWETYRREVGRLLAEGHEGHYAIIKGDRILGVYDSYIAALGEWSRREADRPMMVTRVSEWKRFGRHAPPVKLCHDTPSRSRRTG